MPPACKQQTLLLVFAFAGLLIASCTKVGDNSTRASQSAVTEKDEDGRRNVKEKDCECPDQAIACAGKVRPSFRVHHVQSKVACAVHSNAERMNVYTDSARRLSLLFRFLLFQDHGLSSNSCVVVCGGAIPAFLKLNVDTFVGESPSEWEILFSSKLTQTAHDRKKDLRTA